MREPFWAVVAGKTIKLDFPVLPMAEQWSPFLVQKGEEPAFLSIESASAPLCIPFHGVCFYRDSTGGRIAHSLSDHNTVMYYDANWQHVTTYGITASKHFEMALFELMITAFYSRLTFVEQAMLLHASIVKHQGEAVVFIGPSGIGKTTQAELWRQYAEADILNGDKAFIRMEDGRPCAFGSPWAGSSPYTVNDSAPVKAIIILSQGPTNEIKRLTGFQAFTALSGHTFFPRWDERCTANVMQMVDDVFHRVPIYSLSCRPTEEAVRLTRLTIWE